MSVRRLPLLAVLVTLAAPAGAEAACPERDGYRVVERSGPVIVTARGNPRRGDSTYRACDRRVGRDPILVKTSSGEDDREDVTRILHRGRFVAAFVEYDDKYLSKWITVSLVDVVSGQRLANHAQWSAVTQSERYRPVEPVIGPGGHVAWIEGTPPHRAVLALIGGDIVRIAGGDPASSSRVGNLAFRDDVLRWTVDGVPHEYRVRGPGVDPAVVVRRTPRGVFARLRGSPRRPFVIARSRRPWFVERTLVRGRRIAVVEKRSPSERSGPIEAWRVGAWDARRGRRTGPSVVVPAPPGGHLRDAAFGAGGVVALSVQGDGLARLVAVVDGEARTLGERSDGLFDALRVDAGAVAWLDAGRPRRAPLAAPPAR